MLPLAAQACLLVTISAETCSSEAAHSVALSSSSRPDQTEKPLPASGLTTIKANVFVMFCCWPAGDMYAHNIMLEGESHAVLCDFGAAFCYDRTAAAGCWEAMEVRAFGLFMHGLIQQISDGSSNGSSGGSAGVRNSGSNRQGASGAVQQLHALVEACLADDPAARPTFADLQKQLERLQL